MRLEHPCFVRVLCSEEFPYNDATIVQDIFHFCESIPMNAVLVMYIELEARRNILDAGH